MIRRLIYNDNKDDNNDNKDDNNDNMHDNNDNMHDNNDWTRLLGVETSGFTEIL